MPNISRMNLRLWVKRSPGETLLEKNIERVRRKTQKIRARHGDEDFKAE